MKIKILIWLLLINFEAHAESRIFFAKSRWTELKFNNILPNKVEYRTDSILVNVDSTASPLIYKLDDVTEVAGFEALIEVSGELPTQGAFEEDSFFRMGLVAIGESQLGTMGKLFAPNWVLQLFELAPKGAGLDKIYFFNLAANVENLNKERTHPDSKYMYEKQIALKKSGLNEIKYTLAKSLKTAAIWISIDGDNTKSKFTTEIKNIKLKTNQ